MMSSCNIPTLKLLKRNNSKAGGSRNNELRPLWLLTATN